MRLTRPTTDPTIVIRAARAILSSSRRFFGLAIPFDTTGGSKELLGGYPFASHQIGKVGEVTDGPKLFPEGGIDKLNLMSDSLAETDVYYTK